MRARMYASPMHVAAGNRFIWNLNRIRLNFRFSAEEGLTVGGCVGGGWLLQVVLNH